VNEAATIDNAPPAKDLLAILERWEEHHPDFNTLLLVSLSVLPTGEADAIFWNDLASMLVSYKARHDCRLYTLSQPDRAILVKMSEFNQVSLLTDLKVELLRLIQQYFPESFGMVDQSRLLRNIDLRFKVPNAIKFLERYIEQEEDDQKPVASAPAAARRRLSETDIDRVVAVNKQVGTASFAKVFIKHQKIAVIKPGEPPEEIMHEYFVGMDMLKQHVFKDVELRGSGNLFNQLTITLDRLLLRSFADANPERAKCSINLNVESVFTKAFESFLGETDENAFANVVFEFRQSNILQHYDEYEVAASLINSRNGAIAVDAIFPETVGIMNLDRLSANMAKVFWRQGAEATLPRFREEIERTQANGTQVVFARVDDETAVEVGHELGVTLFQGFHIDRLLEESAT